MRRGARRVLALTTLVAVAVLAVGLWRLLHPAAPVVQQPSTVEAVEVRPHPVPEIIELPATLISSQPVQVLPQTGGVLESVLIRDGQDVEKDQILFVIDPRPLRAVLKQSQAYLARDRALLVDAIDTERRQKLLVTEDSTTEKTYITARNTVNSLRADVLADEAQVRSTALSLEYTEVRAPISGRAGAVLVKAGNVVAVPATSPLVTINVIASIEATFGLARSQLDAVLTATRARKGKPLEVLALHPVTNQLIERGTLVFLDNSFDVTNGTLQGRALFDNVRKSMWPGDFTTVRVLLSDGDGALAVPESALQQGQQGPYVFCVVSGRAALRSLRVARLVNGEAVISQGIRTGDWVITEVPSDLRDGTPVQVANSAAHSSKSVMSGFP